VSDQDQTVTWYRGGEPDERLRAYNEAPGEDEGFTPDLTGGLVNLGFFSAALRRSAWVWCLLAVLGLLIGSALYVKYPPAYHATATVLLVDNNTQNPAVEVLTDQSLAQSQAVAARVVRDLRIPESLANFQANYTVTVVTDTVLTLNVGARSSADAVHRVSALATAFLQYRAQYERNQQQELFAQLDQQKIQAQNERKSLEAQLSLLPSSPAAQTVAQKAAYDSLQNQVSQQQLTLGYVTSTKSAAQTSTDAMVTGSVVLDPATAVHRSKIKEPILYVGGGLLGGLVIGMAGVIFAALLSRRLRRRDDIAIALGAPVKLSVGPLRRRRLALTLPRRSAKRKLDLKRVVLSLRSAVPASSDGPASLALVAVDDVKTVAQLAVLLATSCAGDGKRVVLANLSGGTHLKELLKVSDPGIHRVSQDGVTLVAVEPDPEAFAPVGPLPSRVFPAKPGQAGTALTAVYSQSDLLITLAVLDPAFGGDHLGTWAASAVAVVTAGKSSAEKIHGVGQMIRLSGTRLRSVVLLGVDRSDESIGVLEQALESALSSGSIPGPRGRHGNQVRPEALGPI
jgi:capsular polysaccharide biosynthesis protein